MYQIQRYDCGEWWTFQTTDSYIEAVHLRDNSFISAIITRILIMNETTDKVRCNNCMKIQDKNIITCVNCHTDEYLMQPFKDLN